LITAYVALGGNEGDRLDYLERAVGEMAGHLTLTALSPIYETEPIGFTHQGWFLNAVVAIETALSPQELLAILQAVERKLGKATPFPNGPRPIDLDILLYGDEVLDQVNLIVPHPRLHEREFVMRPLAGLAGSSIVPMQGKTVRQLLNELSSTAEVRPWLGESNVFPNHVAP
jgi:2-amino-4-hydroxy-6-hydroxymethyldihydropteridine diphosphokinase